MFDSPDQEQLPGEATDKPSSNYKYQRLRERLREAVASGELSGKLPGERVLAKRYQANAKTINKALSDLTLAGLLERHVGRGTFVRTTVPGGPVPASSSSRMFGWVSCVSDRMSCPFYPTAEGWLHQRGLRLRYVAVKPKDDGEGLNDRDIHVNQIRGLSGLVLWRCRPDEDLLAGLLRRRTAVVIGGNSMSSVRVGAAWPDYAQGAFELTQHLVQLGHVAIGLVLDAHLLPAAGTAEAGYLAALQRHGLSPLPVLWLSEADLERDPLIRLRTPSAVIAVGRRVAHRLRAAAQKANLRIPGQLSLTAFLEDDTPAPGLEELTVYEVPHAQIVHGVLEILLSVTPGQAPRLMIHPGRLRLGRSTAPPAGGPATVPPPTQPGIL